MEPLTKVHGHAAPLLRPNIDTDTIIRAQRLIGSARTGLGQFLFENLRKTPDGSEDPSFVLNRAPYVGTPILLAGPNFGCGSSREGAVWTLADAGIRCVIAPSYSDIFFNNCFQNGVLPIEISEAEVIELAECTEATGAPMTVDLERRVIVRPDGKERPFEVDSRKREALLAGVDEITLTLQMREVIEAWQAQDRQARAWIWDFAKG